MTTDKPSRTCLVGFRNEIQAVRLKQHIQLSNKNDTVFCNDAISSAKVEYIDDDSQPFATMMQLNNFCIIDVQDFEFDNGDLDIRIHGTILSSEYDITSTHVEYLNALYEEDDDT